MPTFHKRCASLLVFVDHGFERSVIPGYLPRLTRPEPILYFFRDVHGIYPITQPALRKRTQDYPPWVAAFARHHPIPLPWSEPERKKPGLRQEDYARPYLWALERQPRFAVSFIFHTMEQGPHFRSGPAKFPTDDPHDRILRRLCSGYTHYYFSIRDEVLAPMSLGVGSFLPFPTPSWSNAHSFSAGELQRQGVRFHQDDHAFLSLAHPEALPAAADRLRPEIIRPRLQDWTLVLGPKFSKKDRAALPLPRPSSLQQVE